jgi:hypothetical protein
MRRRQVLRGAALAGAIGVAGCISQSPTDEQAAGPGNGNDDGDPDQTDTPRSTDTEPAAEGPTPTAADDDSPTDTLEPTAEPTDEPTSTPLGGPDDEETRTKTPRSPPPMPDAVADHTFEITEAECGQQTDTADIQVSGSEVVVTGTIWGADTCATAALESVELEDGELTVRVQETERDTEEMCGQCIVEIDYETTYVFEDDAPDAVAVQHLHSDTTETVAST